jgi:hypothetical protein
MANYKVVAMPNSSYEDKVKAYYNFLTEECTQSKYSELSPEEFEIYKAGWQTAMMVARHNLTLWFPEVEVK